MKSFTRTMNNQTKKIIKFKKTETIYPDTAGSGLLQSEKEAVMKEMKTARSKK